MATNVSSSAASGTSVFTLIYAGIILGKIFGVIHWSWLAIFSPVIVIVCLMLIAAFVAFGIPAITKRKRK